MRKDTEFKWAKQKVGIPYLLLELDNSDSNCKRSSKERNTMCFYTIVMFGNKDDQSHDDKLKTSKISLFVNKIQQNYMVLRNNQPIVSEVNRQDERFFRFRLFGKRDNLEKLTF